MNLPTLNIPKFSLTVPSTGETVTYRPFLVGEEKILLLAQEQGKPEDMLRAINEIIELCTFNKLKANELTQFDVEYIFIQLRARSVGEIATIQYPCEKCEESCKVEVDLTQVQMEDVEPLPKTIEFADGIGVVPKRMSAVDTTHIAKYSGANDDDSKADLTGISSALFRCVVKEIYDSENVYPLKDVSDEDLDAFVSSLSRKQMEKIEALVQEQPKAKIDVKFKCKCGHTTKTTIEGANNFF